MMTTNVQGGSATIYPFPARGRFASTAGNQDSEQAKAAAPCAVGAVSGSGWYHDEAIEAERARLK
jgi:hypothetical protein